MEAVTHGIERVLITTDAVGGVWQYSLDLVQELRRDDVEVTLVCLGPPPSVEQRQQLTALQGLHFVAEPFALEWAHDPWASIAEAATWLTRLEKEFKPDVVHLNSYVLAAARWKAPVLCVAHSCVYSWWQAVHGCAPGESWSNYKHQVKRGLEAAAAVVAPSHAMLQSILSEYGVAPEKTAVIPNFSAAQPPRVVNKEHFLLAAGRMWDKAKNLSLLKAIAPYLSWPLYLAGSNEGAIVDVRSIQVLGSLAHEDLLQKMAAASLFVHPALYEPFGLAILEAAQAGCCLVLADIPSLRELWEGAAIFVDPHDPSAWITALNRLIEDPIERDQLARAASHAAQRYSASTTLGLYRDLYSRIAARKKLEGGVAA